MAKIGLITDIHNGPATGYDLNSTESPEPYTAIWGSTDQRWRSNAPTRLAAMFTTATAQGCTLSGQLGDLVDFDTDDCVTDLQEIVAVVTSDWTGKAWFNVRGNHENGLWGSDVYYDSKNDWTTYNANINDLTPGNSWASDATGTPTMAYSWDQDSIHWVCFYNGCEVEGTGSGGTGNWLDEDLAATSLPIVIFSHAHLHGTQPKTGIGFLLSHYSEHEAVRAILESYNVQAVFQGHVHPIPLYYDTTIVVNEIPYFQLRGSLVGPADGSEQTSDYYSHYVADIRPDAVAGATRMKANIQLTGYNYVNGETKAFNTYGCF